MPGWVPDDFDFRGGDTWNTFEVGFGVIGDDGAHAATWGGEGHLHAHFLSTFGVGFEFETVNESKVNDVDGDFGIENFFECFPELFLIDGDVLVGILSGLGCGVDGFAEGIGVFSADAEHPIHRHDGEVTAEAMGDGDGFTFGERHGGTLWDEGGFDFAGEGALIFRHNRMRLRRF